MNVLVFPLQLLGVLIIDSYWLCWLVSRVEAHFRTTDIEDSHDILQEHISQDIWSRSTSRNGKSTLSAVRVGKILVDKISRINPEVNP